MSLTVLIPTYNCEDIIEDCLKSVCDIADEILIVDSFSKDRTLEICEKYGAKIIQRKYGYSADQKNWAIPQAKNEWIFLIDSDERATECLRKEIRKELNGIEQKPSDKKGRINGFQIARRHYFLGKWLRFGGRYPLYNVRLFRKSCRYEDRNVHAHILLPKNQMGKLKGDIIHLSDRSLEQIMEKMNRYSTYQASYMVKMMDRKVRIDWKELFTNSLMFKAFVKDIWFFVPFSPFFRFVYMFIFCLGFLDGREGFTVALLYSFEDFISKNKYKQIANLQKDRKLGWFLRLRLGMEKFGYQILEK
ncbi:MAG: glycosyltransferase family 2 protein [bacterium]